MTSVAREDFSVCILGSGSKGNASYVRAGDTRMLIDAGFSGEEMMTRLSAIGVGIETIGHILITHEHDDHIRGLRVIGKKFNGTVHVNEPTYLHVAPLLPKRAHIHIFTEAIQAGAVTITPFSLSHDAAAAVGFTLSYGGRKMALATDTGTVTPEIKDHLRGSHVLILESNHDERLLMLGSYPRPLKQRIASRYGHLSNRQAAELMVDIGTDQLHTLVLAHLSEQNNTPDIAHQVMRRYLDQNNTSVPRLMIAPQHHISETIRI